MNFSRMMSTTIRVLKQLQHDHRTLALVLFMPTILMTILYFVFEGNNAVFNRIAPLILGIVPFTLMFIITSVAMLRERTSGTLERLLTLPVTRLDLIGGYAFAFALLALAQATLATLVSINLLNVDINGSTISLLIIAMLSGVLGMAFGLLFSAFAKNEFQAVQFMPAFVLPQFLTCGLFIPRENMADLLQYFSNIMPLTYIVKALQEVRTQPSWNIDLTFDVVILSMFAIAALVMGAVSLRSK